jgi:DNA-binding transcriptional ArsR family regulator
VGNDDNAAAPAATSQFKALGHPMRHRLLAALSGGEATISQLAVALDSNKGNVAHHLKVLADAGLVELAGTQRVRGGTEQYYRRTMSGPDVSRTTLAEDESNAFAVAEPGVFLALRTLRLTPRHAERLTTILRDLAGQPDDGDGRPYSVILGLYQLDQTPPPGTSTTSG